jgi:transcriptional regulator with XRE-family HTH domain
MIATMATKRISMSEQIRRAIRDSGMTRYRICQEIGITQPSMTRFMQGKAWLSMPTLDKIAELLDLDIVAGKRSKKKG